MTANPLLPADVDLRDFPYMPVDIVRLFGSAFHARASDAEWRAGVTLWLKSFHQVPAASLPDDDIELARLAELGRDVRTWRKVRAMALHGWVKAHDGRLYHEVVAEKALEAWIEKLGQRKSSGAANAKRWGGEFDPAAIETQISDAIGMLTALNPHSRALRRKLPKPPTGSADGSPVGMPTRSQEKRREGNIPPTEANASSGGQGAKPRQPRPKGSVLPDDWAPKDRHYALGASLGLSRRQVDGRAAQMRSWALANQHREVGRKSDWDAAFDNWLRKDNRHGNSNGHRDERPAAIDTQLAAFARAAGLGDEREHVSGDNSRRDHARSAGPDHASDQRSLRLLGSG